MLNAVAVVLGIRYPFRLAARLRAGLWTDLDMSMSNLAGRCELW